MGVIAGWIAAEKLVKKYGHPKSTIRIVSFVGEEGNRFSTSFWGSKNFLGIQDDNEVKDIVDAMHESGFDFRKGEARFCDIGVWLDLHVEQGKVLQEEKKNVGLVTNIVGQKRWTVTLKGEANHAGTTLMHQRKDAIECFSRIATSSLGKAKEEGDPLVLIFGQVDVSPNSVSVIPGEVMFTMDCRHSDKKI